MMILSLPHQGAKRMTLTDTQAHQHFTEDIHKAV